MARFILDVNSSDTTDIMAVIMDLFADSIASITCINESNETQFHENADDNKLTDSEIKLFNDAPHG